MKPIEPGCLCVVIGCKRNPDNLGCVVEAVRKVPFGEYVPETGGIMNESAWLIKGDNLTKVCLINGVRHYSKSAYAFAREEYLMRIDGYEEPALERESEEVMA